MGSGGRPASGGRVVRHRTDGQLKRTSRLGDGSVTRCGDTAQSSAGGWRRSACSDDRETVGAFPVASSSDVSFVEMSEVTGRAIAALVLLSLVAVASTSRFGGGGRPVSSPAGYVVLGMAGVVVLVAILFWLTIGGFAARVDMRRGTRLVLFGTLGAVLLAAGALLFLPPYHSPVSPPGSDPCARPPSYYAEHHIDVAKLCGSGTAYAGEKAAGGGGGGDSTVALVLAAGASLLTLVVLGTAAVMALRRRRSREELAAENAPVLEALDESLEDLRRERDVRRAIVACYARMERAFAGSGRARRAHETPLEFLRRVLERVAHEPGQALTELFERARFSVEPMGETEKRSAIAALEQLRAEVAG